MSLESIFLPALVLGPITETDDLSPFSFFCQFFPSSHSFNSCMCVC